MLRKTIYLTLFLIGLLLPQGATTQALPPKGSDETYMMVPPGLCADGLIEIGTYKPDIGEFWTRNPRKFVSPCEIFVEKTFVGRYRLAARCVDANTLAPRSVWVRSYSGLGKPWPDSCTGFVPGAPRNSVPPGG